MDTFYYCILVLAVLRYSNGVQNPPTGRCVSLIEYKMMAADCKWLNLVEIPQVLNKNIEIMVATGNRIRVLRDNSFKEYTSLKFLYLDNNFIMTIEEGTFSPLTELEVLNLNYNAIKNVPAELPYPLRKLYLSQNPLEVVPLSAAYNLQFLTLSDCNLKELPDIGVLPNLLELNLTGNPLSTLTPLQLSSMCHLTTIYVPTSLYKETNMECECHKFLTWTTNKFISVGNYSCTSLEKPDDNKCYTNNSEEVKKFESCLLAEPRIAFTKYYILAVFLLAVIIMFVILCCCRRKKKRKPNPKSRTNCSQNQEKKITTLIL